MQQQFHILNGDALKSQFPDKLRNNIIVARECLMEGDVSGNTPEEFYANRAKFLGEYFGEFGPGNYYTETVPEFEKICNIPVNSDINLWFEDDLFCQVNFWFVASLIHQNKQNYSVYLVRPSKGNEYSFGKMSEDELMAAYRKRVTLTPAVLKQINDLWENYRNNQIYELIQSAEQLSTSFPFIQNAVEAHVERIPVMNNPGQPIRSLQRIIKELNTTDFASVFKEFCKREEIYGYGDWQVQKMMETITKK